MLSTTDLSIAVVHIGHGRFSSRSAWINAVTGFRGYSNEMKWTAVSVMSGASWYMSVRFCRELTLRRGLTEFNQAYLDPLDYDGDREKYRSSAGVLNPPKNWPLDFSKEGFRLPTSAEWEIACRGLTVTRYGFGCDDDHLGRYGWYEDVSLNRGHRPRELRPNHRGLFDVHGNMYEWCHDWLGGKTVEELIDPMGPREGVFRVMRGGGWGNFAGDCRSANRFGNQTTDLNGFRVVLSLGVSSSHPQ